MQCTLWFVQPEVSHIFSLQFFILRSFSCSLLSLSLFAHNTQSQVILKQSATFFLIPSVLFPLSLFTIHTIALNASSMVVAVVVVVAFCLSSWLLTNKMWILFFLLFIYEFIFDDCIFVTDMILQCISGYIDSPHKQVN